MNEGFTCCICSQIAGDRSHDLLAQLLGPEPYVRRVPFETEHFAVIPSVGPLVPGHLLLCPKLHLKSFSSLPGHYELEYQKAKKEIVVALQSTFRAPVHSFEHGMPANGSRTLCSVDHAHMHLVPANVRILGKLGQIGQLISIQSTIRDLKYAAGSEEYILYESPDNVGVVIKALDGGFESQYMRRVFADALERGDEWNWRENPHPEIIEDTLRRFETSALLSRTIPS